MDLNHLRYFYEVAKAGSFTSAAANLHISQSALSKTVGLLENREGIKLLERSKKGVTLTPLGQEIFDRCQALFNEVQEIQDRVHGATVKCEGYLRFGASDHLARYLIVDKLKGFIHHYPLVIPSMVVGSPVELITQIMKNEIEFGLFFTRIKTPGLEYKRIGVSELVLVTSEQTNPHAEAKDIGKLGLVGSVSRQYQRHPSHRIFEITGTEPNIVLETNSQELQKRICMSGVGCALLAKFMVEKELRNKQLREIKLPKKIQTDLLLAKRKNHVFTRPTEKFLEKVILSFPTNF